MTNAQAMTDQDREKARRLGLPNSDNAAVASYLLRLSEEQTTFAAVAVLVEAAARLDGPTYLEWIRS